MKKVKYEIKLSFIVDEEQAGGLDPLVVGAQFYEEFKPDGKMIFQSEIDLDRTELPNEEEKKS